MIVGPARILTCPHCGTKKEVVSLFSGNTFGVTQWSDGRREFPMLLTPSEIQKCPECGKFYFVSKQEHEEYAKNETTVTGELSFSEAQQAYATLFDPRLTDEDNAVILQTVIFAYNKEYSSQGKEPEDITDKDFFTSCLNKMATMFADIIAPIFLAEYWREQGCFVECIKVLQKITPNSKFQENLIFEIARHACNLDKNVFVVPDIDAMLPGEEPDLNNLGDYLSSVLNCYFSLNDEVSLDGALAVADNFLKTTSEEELDDAIRLEDYNEDDQDVWSGNLLSRHQCFDILASIILKDEALRIKELYNQAFEHIDDKVWQSGHVSLQCYGEWLGIGLIALHDYMKEKNYSFDCIEEVKILSLGWPMAERCDCLFDFSEKLLNRLFPHAKITSRSACHYEIDFNEYASTTSLYTIHLIDEAVFEGNEIYEGKKTSDIIYYLLDRESYLYDIFVSISKDIPNDLGAKIQYCQITGIKTPSGDNLNEWGWFVCESNNIPRLQLIERSDDELISPLALDDKMEGKNAHESIYNTCYDILENDKRREAFIRCLQLIQDYEQYVDHSGKVLPAYIKNLIVKIKVTLNYKGMYSTWREDLNFEDFENASPLYRLNHASCLYHGYGMDKDLNESLEILKDIVDNEHDWADSHPEVYRLLARVRWDLGEHYDAKSDILYYLYNDNCKCKPAGIMQYSDYLKKEGDDAEWIRNMHKFTKEYTGCMKCNNVTSYNSEKRVCPKVQLAAAFAYENGDTFTKDEAKAFYCCPIKLDKV